MGNAAPAPKRILIVHAAEDRDAAQKLRRHLGAPRRRDVIVTSVEDHPAGAPWRETIDQQVDQADVVVALLSADLLSSDLWDHELSRIGQRRPALRLVPLLARSASLEGTMFEGLQALPRSGVPVATHEPAQADDVWTGIVRELRCILLELTPDAARAADLPPAVPRSDPRVPSPRPSEMGVPSPRPSETGVPSPRPSETGQPPLPRRLVEAAQQGRLVAFAGAGVSMAVRGARREEALFPSWAGLLEKAAARLEADGLADDAASVRGAMRRRRNPSYLEAARIARDSLGPVWFEVLRSTLDLPRQEALDASLDLPRALWGLGSQLILTTNYDRVLHWACPDRENLRTWSIEAAAEQIGMLRDGAAFPTVWHLHGVITDATHLILTPDGYGRLYGSDDPGAVAAGESRYRAALTSLRMLLALRTVLFVGFSFDDASFAGQLAWLEETFRGAAGPHYVFVREAERERLAERVGNLPVVPVAYADHGAPLVALLRRLAGARV